VDAPLASGREADVWALDDERVLRRYRDGDDVGPEAAMMAYVGAAGYPVPRVYAAEGTDLVMERLDGGTMLGALLAGRLDLAAGADLLVDLHTRLHAIPGRVVHLDLHADNVMLTSRGPVVIDWRNAAEGPPDRDVAMTALIMAQAAFWDDPAIAAAARAGLEAFQERADPPARAELLHVVGMRRRNPTMSPAELAALDEAAALVRTR
jgi:aminoglycoside phosphotransferase (APT) family kinase protein